MNPTEEKNKRTKIDISQSLLKSMKWRKSPLTKLMLNVIVMWCFFPISYHLIFVEVIVLEDKQVHGTLTWGAGSIIVGIFRWLLDLVYFYLSYSHGLDLAVQTLVKHSVIMHCWDENLLGASASSSNPGATASEPMWARNIFPVPYSV